MTTGEIVTVVVQLLGVVFLGGVFVGTTRGQTRTLKGAVDAVGGALEKHVQDDVRVHARDDQRIRDIETGRTVPRVSL